MPFPPSSPSPTSPLASLDPSSPSWTAADEVPGRKGSQTHPHNSSPSIPAALWSSFIYGDFHQRWEAAKSLGRLGAGVVPALVALLDRELGPDEDEDEDLQWFVARLLGEVQHPDGVAALVALVQGVGERPEVAATAMVALAQGGPRVLPELTQLLQVASTRRLAIQGLAQIQHPSVIELLLPWTQDAEVGIRGAALEALAYGGQSDGSEAPFPGDRRVLGVLTAALTDLDASVRQIAIAGIGARARRLGSLQRQGYQGTQGGNPEEMAYLDQLTVHLGSMLYDLKLAVSLQAAIALGRLGTPAALEHLVQALAQSLAQPLRLQILRALGWNPTPEAIAALGQELQQLTPPPGSPSFTLAPEEQVLAREAIAILGRMESETARAQAAQILVDWVLLVDTQGSAGQASRVLSPSIKEAIALSLGWLGQPQGIAVLTPWLDDSTDSVRFHAIAALKRLLPGEVPD